MAKQGGFKRKDLDIDFVAGDDFSLSPALKIRRLVMDTESLLPTMDEDGGGPATYHHQSEDGKAAPVVVMEESVPSPQSENLERALVLFKPVNICSQSNYSVALDSQFLSSLKRDQLLGSGQRLWIQSAENQIGNASERDGCKAVVPWVSQHPFQAGESQEPMEPDEAGVVSMDVDDSVGNGNIIEQGCQFYKSSVPQLQHCLIPELPRNNRTPVILLR